MRKKSSHEICRIFLYAKINPRKKKLETIIQRSFSFKQEKNEELL